MTIGGTTYKFVKHREIGGVVKTLTIKRDSVGRLWLVFSVLEKVVIPETSTGHSGGSPQFYKQGLRKTRQLSRDLSRKVEGSNHHKRARRALATHQAHLANQRRNHHFQLAHDLCAALDVLRFEDLNLSGMKALWGRKVSDLGFASFLSILEWVAFKRGKTVVQIDRFAPSTQVCSGCGHVHALTLRDRTLTCRCGLTIDRDHNAAINIHRIGTSMLNHSVSKTQARLRRRVDGRSPRL